jgi:hypothetical protein
MAKTNSRQLSNGPRDVSEPESVDHADADLVMDGSKLAEVPTELIIKALAARGVEA